MCPMQTKLMDAALMSEDEKAWVNAYHDEVLQKLRPLLTRQGDARGVAWLEKECAVRM